MLLMIVSIAIAVLPVWRSPMISSRWPRPIGIIESIAFRPVSIGSFTGWRCTTPGALCSAGRVSVGLDLALAVERVAERVDDPPQQRLADRDVEQAPGAPDGVALDDLLPLAEQHGADVVGLEVEREPGHAVRQVEHLERHAVLQAVDAADAVGDRQHGPDLGEIGARGVEALDPALEDRGDFVGLDLHVTVSGSLRRGAQPTPCATCLRSCSRRFLIEASRIEVARPAATIPPRMSGSTGWSSRSCCPLCSPIRSPMRCTVSSSSCDRAGDLRPAAAAWPRPTVRRTRARIRKITGIRWRSISASRKFTNAGSASVTARCRPSFFSSRREVRREEEHASWRFSSSASANCAELLADLVQRVVLVRDLEQRARVDLGDLLHDLVLVLRRPSALKSSSPSASSTRRRWSSSVSVLRVTFSVASTVRSATSLRIS